MSRKGIMLPLLLAVMAISGEATAQDAAEPPRQIPASMIVPLEKSRLAIEECRQQRLRGQLSSYKMSAECSSPRIFAAWREANYPHMDLITAWVNEREAASERVDQRTMTPKEFDLKMAELTNRLTAEERRRSSGLLQSGNNELQLPPSAPASQSRRTAAARAGRAIDPSSVETMETLSPLNPTARSGVGGPYVPVSGPEPSVTRTPNAGSALPAYVFVASAPSEEDAASGYHSLQRAFPGILRRLQPIIRPVDAANPDTAYRVQVGPFNNTAANDICSRLRAAGANCSVQYN
jgi:hypothetical protein